VSDEMLHQLAQAVAMQFITSLVGSAGGMGIRHVELGTAKP